MPKRKDLTNDSESIRVRVSQDTRNRCTNARLAGAHKREAESSFLGYLLELGLAKYEKIVLPIENADNDMENKNSSLNSNSLLFCSEDRFLELLLYFPENIKNRIIEEKLDWEQVKKQFGPILTLLLYKAEAIEKRTKEKEEAIG